MVDEKKWMFVEEGHSELYKRFRPKHPASLFSLIDSKLQTSTQALSPSLQQKHARNSDGRWAQALDVGCGTGLSTLPLLPFVQETFGIDRSQSQIHQAIIEYGSRDPSRVTFIQADVSEALSMFPAASFDLITVAMAAHWMNREQLAKAALQLLRPGGLLVLYSYRMHIMLDDEADRIVGQFMNGVIVPVMEKDARLALNGYHEIQAEVQKFFPVIERDETISYELEWSVDDIRGYFTSLGSYQKYLQQKKESEVDLLDECMHKLKAANISGGKLKSTTPYFVLFARNPEN